MCVCVCVCVCTCVGPRMSMYMCGNAYTYSYMCMCAYMCMCMYVYAYAYTGICMCVRVCMCVYACVCIRVYVCVYCYISVRGEYRRRHENSLLLNFLPFRQINVAVSVPRDIYLQKSFDFLETNQILIPQQQIISKFNQILITFVHCAILRNEN